MINLFFKKLFGKIPSTRKYTRKLELVRSELQKFNELTESSKLLRYKELEAIVLSSEHINKRNETKKLQYKESQEYQLDIEYGTLKKDEEIKWYFKKLKKNNFEPHRNWKLVFDDTFKTLDTDKWLTIPLHGMISLNNHSYVTEDNLQFHTENKNLKLQENCLSIETRQEKTSGRKWRPETGFQIEDFDYTSGLINTGHSFRLKGGLIEVVARMSNAKEIVHAVSLKSDAMVPHIDMFCTGMKKKFKVRMFLNNNPKPDFEEIFKGINLNKKIHYSLEWAENQLIWRINGFTIAEYHGKMPAKQMYISISSVILHKPKNLPAQFAIESVRVFEKQK